MIALFAQPLEKMQVMCGVLYVQRWLNHEAIFPNDINLFLFQIVHILYPLNTTCSL